jgi:hypothetical protein
MPPRFAKSLWKAVAAVDFAISQLRNSRVICFINRQRQWPQLRKLQILRQKTVAKWPLRGRNRGLELNLIAAAQFCIGPDQRLI